MEQQVAAQSINVVLFISSVLGWISVIVAILWRSYSIGKMTGVENEKIKGILLKIITLETKDTELELEIKKLENAMVKLERDILKEIREIKPELRPCNYFVELSDDYKRTKENIFEKVNIMAVDIGKIKTALELKT